MQEIKVELTKQPKAKPTDETKLGFGSIFTDHMFVMNYDEGQGWHDARIVPYGPIELDPSAMCLHYGQTVFEGMKAYRAKDGRVLLFRPEKNMARINVSNERLFIPKIDEAFALKCIEKLVSIEKDWIPTAEGTSLYIRPFIFATDAHVGVHPGKHLMFMVICSPVGAYYPEGLNPVKIYVESKYVRAVRGGMGYAKTGGNYAASLKAQDEAEEQKYTQVLWLDGVERKYVEEVGTMNIMFKIGGEIYTAPIEGTVLPGVTRDSIIHILKDWGYKVNETHLAVDDLMKAGHDGTLEEAFGTGTAAVISPVGEFVYKDDIVKVNNFEIGKLTQKLYDYLTGIQWGDVEDKYGWTVDINA